ncbi:hypothetical protein [Ancylomarina longa]|uniref:NodB homology domain-containing protein n=1 Tax=Ancylomarina longa TaxID=2487017 RepID=A0A434ATY2_9BACT|nr:hypothetical protein [Ancylomarina longa]RUT77884.1 hypothetical protein DLK05_11130 [Ancylomarina longa]
MTALCLTIDYELFGSGKGDVFQHIIEPTNQLLDFCLEFDIKLTIFFEVVEYWKIKENYENGVAMGYEKSPADAMVEQIQRAYQLGHDIQLHLHPQWIDAKYENEEWILNLDYWRLPDVPDQANDTISMGLKELIWKGKQEIESILHPINPAFQCNIIRAGGYNIDPSDRLLKALKENSFLADSSVYYGGYANGKLSRYNYRHIPETKPYWFTEPDSLIRWNGFKSGFLELPIFAKKMKRIYKYDGIRIRSALKNKKNALEKFKNNSNKKSKWQTIRFLMEEEAITWDFCLFSKSKMSRFLRAAQQVERNSESDFHPFVLVGHPKDFYYTNGIEFLANREDLEFYTLTEMLKKIRGEE